MGRLRVPKEECDCCADLWIVEGLWSVVPALLTGETAMPIYKSFLEQGKIKGNYQLTYIVNAQ